MRTSTVIEAIRDAIAQAIADRTLVRVERSAVDPHTFDGYILASSETLVLMAIVSGDIRLNGYTVLRTGDITYVENPAPHSDFQQKALTLRQEAPSLPEGIQLDNLKALMTSLSAISPLMTINRERIDPEICYIGRLRLAGDNKFLMDEIDPDASWYKTPAEFRYDEITRVDFDTAYEQALHLVATADRSPEA